MISPMGRADAITFPAIYLLHGKGGSPNGTVSKLQECLQEHWPQVKYIRPALPHGDPTVQAEASVEFLRNVPLETGSLVIGVSLGGLVAAKLQEESRPDLHVICISSPTWADGVKLLHRAEHRVAVYSVADAVISDRIENWSTLAEAYEFAWLDHDTDKHLGPLTRLVGSYVWDDLSLRARELS
jgi:pimeloyl-ACP methyl ester carboxylesterase